MNATSDDLIGIGAARLAEQFTDAHFGRMQLKVGTIGACKHEHVVDHTVHVIHHTDILLNLLLVFLLCPRLADTYLQ